MRMKDSEQMKSKLDAIDRTMAIIEFQPDGTIVTANDNFCQAMGYRLSEIVGQHHRIFMAPDEAQSREYATFWQRLSNGEAFQDRFRRIAKSGDEIWIQATYNPVFDENNNVVGVVKFATDVTAQTLRDLDAEGMMAAINRSFAVIEFELDGTVINANDNFCQTMGYGATEIQGKHHRQFVGESFV